MAYAEYHWDHKLLDLMPAMGIGLPTSHLALTLLFSAKILFLLTLATVVYFKSRQAKVHKQQLSAIGAYMQALANGDLKNQLIPIKNIDLREIVLGYDAIVQHLTDKTMTITQAAEGNLDVSVDIQSPRDILGKSINGMIRNLSNVVANALQATATIEKESQRLFQTTHEILDTLDAQAVSINSINNAFFGAGADITTLTPEQRATVQAASEAMEVHFYYQGSQAKKLEESVASLHELMRALGDTLAVFNIQKIGKPKLVAVPAIEERKAA
jgi:methyl-accepting chemotaxis protein